MSKKRISSSALTDAIVKENKAAKKKKQQDKRDAEIRATNRLHVKKTKLATSVQNLKWEKKRLESDTLKLKVEISREEAKRNGPNRTAKQIRPVPPRAEIPAISTVGFSGNTITNFSVNPTPSPIPTPPVIRQYFPFSPVNCYHTPYSPPILPVNAGINVYSPAPFSDYVRPSNFFQSPVTLPKVNFDSPPPAYRPPPIPSPTPSSSSYKPLPLKHSRNRIIPTYIPTPLTNAQKKAQNNIKFVTDRPFEYWENMRKDITTHKKYGKRLYQNPADGLWFDIFHYELGGIRVRIGTEWHSLAYSDEGKKK